ncbi:MAG TPA: S-adenosylmethionine decarboxylase [Deinococcales bacterium]|nr:S-adenosylmethionine decarboxylase [Deinococcales bacterium]
MNDTPRPPAQSGGRWVAEAYGCDPARLEDEPAVRAAMTTALEHLGVPHGTLNAVFHKFSPQGLSGTVMAANALLAIHTWPEDRAATLDLYLYRAHPAAEPELRGLAASLGATDMRAFEVRREPKPADPI